MQLLARISTALQIELAVGTIFAAPTVIELAGVVKDKLLASIEALPEDEPEDPGVSQQRT
jgi:hypothetical protein